MRLCLRMKNKKKKGAYYHHHVSPHGGSSLKHITDANLEHFLHDQPSYQLFLKWAEDNLCSENLWFYADVENYKNIQDDEYARTEAERIYHKYIKDKADFQVNLDFESKKEVEDGLINPNRHIFDQSQYTVHELIKYDLLTKFLDSDIYRVNVGLPTLRKLNIPRRVAAKVSEMPRLSTESVQKLDVCLRDPVAREEFLNFTKREYSSALPLFYLEVQKFQRQPTPELAETIYEKYLGPDSEDEVDADPRIKRTIQQSINSGNIQHDLFDKLQIQVYSCMAQDNFFRFQKYMISRLAVV